MPSSASLTGLFKWLRRPDWAEPFEEMLWLHMGATCEALDLEQDDIEDLLGAHYAMTLWGCAFEDFLTRALEPDGRNIVDDYLKRRGWKETATARRYMQALRGSVMSLYEVSDIVPGEFFMARDLLRGGEPVRVTERTATRSLAQWERIGARVVSLNGTYVIAGGLLPFSQEASARVVQALKPKRRARRKTTLSTADERSSGIDGSSEGPAQLDLCDAAPMFSNLWLADVLPRMLDPHPPKLVNNDGDEISFHTVRYRFLSETTDGDVRARLTTIDALHEAGNATWNWIETATPSIRGVADEVLTFSTTLDDGGIVSGTVEIKDGAVVMTANSSARAERGRDLLTPLLDGLVRAPLTEIQTVEQLMESRPSPEPAAGVTFPPEVLTQVVHESLDKHYRATLDQPVGMLGGRTPRACVRSRAGRDKVVEWLKYLERENSRPGRDDGDPMRSYDFSWLWDELGVADLRR